MKKELQHKVGKIHASKTPACLEKITDVMHFMSMNIFNKRNLTMMLFSYVIVFNIN